MRKTFAVVMCRALGGPFGPRPLAASVVDAAMTGNRDAVKTLLQSGADVNTALGRRHDGAALRGRARTTPRWRGC